MDPTKKRLLSPVKSLMDKGVFLATTYVVPAAICFFTMSSLEQFAGRESAEALTAFCDCFRAILGFDGSTGMAYLFCRDVGTYFCIPVAGGLVFWALVYDAVGRYRRRLALPRAIDMSLDATPRTYVICLIICLLNGLFHVTVVWLSCWIAPRFAWQLVCVTATSMLADSFLNSLSQGQRGTPRFLTGTVGMRLKPVALVREMYDRSVRSTLRLSWGGVNLDISQLIKNFLIVGSVGSGKTLVFRRWLQDVLPCVGQYKDWRAMVVDPKSELYGFMLRLLPSYKVKLLSPGDGRSFVWRIAQDIKEPKHIRELCYILIPDDGNESQPYFRDGARRLLYGVILAFTLLGDKWRFSDIFFAARSAKRLSAILRLFPETVDILETYSKNAKAFADIHSTLDTKIAVYLTVAEAWSHMENASAHKTVSLTEWVNGNFALLVSTQASAGESHQRLIGAIVKRATQLVLDGPTGQSLGSADMLRRTIIAVEEGPRAGRLDLVSEITSLRDFGATLCYLFQSKEAMTKWFPKNNELDAIVNEFHTVAFLKTNSPITADWMSRRIGKQEVVRHRKNNDGKIVETETKWATSVEPTEFMTLGQGSTISPDFVPGIFANSEIGAWYSDDGVSLVKDKPNVPQNVPAPKGSLRPWDDADLVRLGLAKIKDQLELGMSPSPTPPSFATKAPKPPTSSRKSSPPRKRFTP